MTLTASHLDAWAAEQTDLFPELFRPVCHPNAALRVFYGDEALILKCAVCLRSVETVAVASRQMRLAFDEGGAA